MLQKKILPGKYYHTLAIDETEYSSKVWYRKEKIDSYDRLMQEGCEQQTVCSALAVARSTLFRWKKRYKTFGLAGLENESRRPNTVRKNQWRYATEQQVYHMRKKYPLWGKEKIRVMLERERGVQLSSSTVGRILTQLLKRNKIQPVRFLFGRKDTKKRVFNGHAQRWKHGMKATKPGELIQVDHMSVHVPNFQYLKNFSAVCPVTRFAVERFYKEATSRNAKDFLEQMKKEFPFPIISIQVDGGGEFIGEFEKACKESNIPLFVLPPRSPEYNGRVERGNGTFKYEFYSQYEGPETLHDLQKGLQNYVKFYNTRRPHQGLGYLTPCQFFEVIGKRP